MKEPWQDQHGFGGLSWEFGLATATTSGKGPGVRIASG